MASFGVNPVSPEASKSWLLRKTCPSWTGSKSTSHNHCDEVLVQRIRSSNHIGLVLRSPPTGPAFGRPDDKLRGRLEGQPQARPRRVPSFATALRAAPPQDEVRKPNRTRLI